MVAVKYGMMFGRINFKLKMALSRLKYRLTYLAYEEETYKAVQRKNVSYVVHNIKQYKYNNHSHYLCRLLDYAEAQFYTYDLV